MPGRLADSIEYNGIKYEWLGHSSVRITPEDGKVIYTDPVLLDDNPPQADLILITHHHVDHCLPEYVAAIRTDKTKVAAFHESYLKYCVQDIKAVRTVRVGQTVSFGPVSVTGVEAYTKRGFHIKGEGCGFLLEVSGQRIYFSGDTARIPEMKALGHVDAAIMPISDNAYAISLEDIVEAVKDIGPEVFIPVHFTPMDEPDPVIKEPFFSTKDPRFFTRKEDPERLIGLLEGTGIRLALLKKLGRQSIGGS